MRSMDSRHLDGLRPTIFAMIDGELDGFTLGQGPKSVRSDGTLMNEEIFAAIVRSYEAEAFLTAEPLHRPSRSLGIRH